MILVPVYNNNLPQISVKTREIFKMYTVHVSSRVSVQLVHNVLLLGIHAKYYWVEGHTVLHSPDNHLEVGISWMKEML